ncbi:dimethylarginine dimethylaminohydrolase [Frigidibacter sp. RF13]|uniref:dimethylarginine dimethylaminohydrolase family protein n=1 Tax=Frigidibacter sp. RF13 TaxID=2997340 RepID=UPI002270E6DC|nr:dimethylarginine dimethylaminohydrolase [Frigidibacter sp. RF13]MCY1127280.1 dimethylarginine dimethylaminohydrolase [Frigidibacter sp. RF13]
MSDRSYRFTHAIVRAPADSATAGLRAVDSGAPDIALMRRHHADYVAALRGEGAVVVELPALEAFPDAQFVEDTALCLQEGAVVMRPGAPSRLGEAAEMAPTLARFYDEVLRIEGPGTIEAGDVLTTETEILVGRSARTDAAGIAEMARLVARWGYRVRELETPPGVLHFKTDCSLLDAETILSTERLAAAGGFDGYRVILTAEGEEAAANAIRFNGAVIVPDGFPRTAERLAKAGYRVVSVGNSECAKLDGGMSCLSLRFSPPKAG